MYMKAPENNILKKTLGMHWANKVSLLREGKFLIQYT